MKSSSKNKKLATFFVYTLLILAAAISMFPFFWTVLTSLKQPIDTFAYPPVLYSKDGITMDNYLAILFPGKVTPGLSVSGMVVNFFHYVKNSFVIVLLSTFITLLASSFAAYSLSRFRFKGRNNIAFFILLTRMIPPIALVIPLFLLVNKFGIYDKHIALILPYTALNIPLATWMLKGFIDDIPLEIENAAMIDGCTRLQSLSKVVLPLMTPGLGATGVFAFIMGWNEFALALALTTRSAATLPLIAMQFVAEEGIYWGPMAAAATIASAPPLILVFFAQRHMIKGLTLGAVKG